MKWERIQAVSRARGFLIVVDASELPQSPELRGFNHLEKYEFVNGKDCPIYETENKKCLKPPTRVFFKRLEPTENHSNPTGAMTSTKWHTSRIHGEW